MQDAVFPAPAQSSTQTETPGLARHRKDAAAILDTAAKLNGLNNPLSGPWHLRVSYQILNDKGQTQDSGTYEELWVAENKYKRIVSGFTSIAVG
jgi:hypothetical protein